MRVLYVRATQLERLDGVYLVVTARGADMCTQFRGDDLVQRVWRFARGHAHPDVDAACRDFPRHVGELDTPRFYTDGSTEATLTLDELNESTPNTFAPTWSLEKAASESCDAYAGGASGVAPLYVVVMSTATLTDALNVDADLRDDDDDDNVVGNENVDETHVAGGAELSRMCVARLSITMFDVLLDLETRRAKSTIVHCVGNTALCQDVAWWFNSEKA